MTNIRNLWSNNRVYRVLLIVALIWVVFRLTFHMLYLGSELTAERQGTSLEFVDLDVYVKAAEKLPRHEDLYLTSEELQKLPTMYLYAPTFAVCFQVLFSWLPPVTIPFIHTLLHIAAYMGLYFCWQRIFQRLHLDQAAMMLAGALPLWLVYYPFWGDLSWLNIHVFIALAVTLLIDSLLQERLWASSLWAVLLLLIKPQWAAAIILPLILGRPRFFIKLILLTVVGYLSIAGLTILALGLEYGLAQFYDYYYFLLVTMRGAWPWRTIAEYGFLGTNHSITQVILYVTGVSPGTMILVTVVKLLLLVPLAGITLLRIFRPRDSSAALDFVFALYLGVVYVWVDVSWSDAFMLGIVIFAYLAAMVHSGAVKTGLWAAFTLYALSDVFSVLGYLVLGDDALLDDPQLAALVTDPNAYFPLLTVVVLLFYSVLLWRLWRSPGTRSAVAIPSTAA